MIRWLIVVLVVCLLPATGTAAGIDRIWSCAYRDCSVLTAQRGDSLDTTESDSVVLGSTAGEVRFLDPIALLDRDFDVEAGDPAIRVLGWDKEITINTSTAYPSFYAALGTLHYDVAPLLSVGPTLFAFQPNIEWDTGSASELGGVAGFYAQPRMKPLAGSTLQLTPTFATFHEAVVFDASSGGSFDFASSKAKWTQFAAAGAVVNGSINELRAFDCMATQVNSAGALATRTCFNVSPQTGGIAQIGINNNSTTVNPPGTALDPTSTVIVSRTVVEFSPSATRNVAIANGHDGQIATFVNTHPTNIINLFRNTVGAIPASNLRVNKGSCPATINGSEANPLCYDFVYLGTNYGPVCTLGQGDTITAMYLDSLSDWVVVSCANN